MGLMKHLLLGLATFAVLLSSPAARPDDDLDRAIALAAENRRAEARVLLDPLLERQPVHPRARLLHGILRAREGLVTEAIEIFDRLRQDHPDMSEPWNNLAVLYAAQGRFDEARETLLAALERKPSAIAYANLGDIYTNLARRAYVRANELDPDGLVRPEPGAKTENALSLPEPPAAAAGAREATGASSDTDAPAAVEPARPIEAPSAAVAVGTGPAGIRPPAVGREDETELRSGPVPQSEPIPQGEPVPQGELVAIRSEGGDADAPEPMCLRTGGVSDRRVLAGVEEWLRSHGAESLEVHRVEETAVRSFRVYLPPYPSRAEAVEAARAVQARGVRDVAVIGSGPLANGVSFGVFRNEDNVRRRLAALTKLGYPVLKKENRGPVERFVLAGRAGRDPDALQAAWAAAFPKRTIEIASCE